MTGLEFTVWVMAFAIVGLCVATSLLIVLSVRYKVSITAKDIQIADLITDQENNLRDVIAWQSKYMDAEARCDKLTIANKQLKAEYDDIHNKYDVVYTEYGYCKQERDDYKKRLEKYEHNVI